MKVLITGGTGHIGVNLVRKLLDENHEPIVLVRESSIVGYLPEETDTVVADITDAQSLNETFETISPDAVAHLAAASGGLSKSSMQGGIDQAFAKKVNVKGTLNTYRAADSVGVKKFVFMNTIKGHPDVSYDGDSPYIRSKIEAETAISESDLDLEYTCIYPTVVIGPYDFRLKHYHPYKMVQSNFALVPPLYIPHTMNPVPMRDVTNTIINSLEVGTEERYVVSGPNIKYRKYLRHISDVSEAECRVLPVPFSKIVIPRMIDILHRRDYLPVPGDAFNWDRSSEAPSQFENERPFGSTNLKDSIKRTQEWYEEVELL
jgi:nucleoside-diphosphate-sugar epimerase